MKKIVIINLVCLSLVFGGSVGCSEASEGATNNEVSTLSSSYKLPELHKIKKYTFEAPYSCNGSYEKSALFLSGYSQQRNSPDLLFNGTCGSPLYVEASTAGDDFALISDLGNVPLETVNARKAFNYKGVVGYDNVFKKSMPVSLGHTYVVLISKIFIRALWVFQVNDISSDGKMSISYAVKSYSIQTPEDEASGFDWAKGNELK